MTTTYASLLRRDPGALAFGAILMALSNVGQTYYIALFNPSFEADVGASIAVLGALHSIGTLATALLFPALGGGIERMSIVRYTTFVAAGLGLGCALVASATSIVALGFGFVLLRLAGMGLMSHVAAIHATRAFPVDAGKALGVFFIGYSMVQGALPLAAVVAIDAIGWRAAWAIAALIVVAGSAVAIRCLPAGTPSPTAGTPDPAPREHAGPVARPLGKPLALWLLMPAFLAVTFILTGVTFHVATIASTKGWSMGWIAIGYMVFAVVQALVSLSIGPWIDRLGSMRFAAAFLLPQVGAILLLIWLDAPWIVPVFLALFAASASTDATLRTTLWLEFVAPHRIAIVRSRFEAARILSTALAPVTVGVAIANGVSRETNLVVALALTLASIALALLATFVDRERRRAG